MKPERKSKMIAMRIRLQKELKVVVDSISMNSKLREHIFFLLQERINQIGIRSFFVYAISRYVKEQAKAEGLPVKAFSDHFFDTQLPFLAEGIITVQYYENQVLDGKGGLYSNGAFDIDKMHRNLIAGHFVKDFLYRYIEEKIFPDSSKDYRLTMRGVHKIYQLVDLGQAFQDHFCTYENFCNPGIWTPLTREANSLINEEVIKSFWKIISSQGLNADKQGFTLNYLRRIYVTSGALFVHLAELVMDLLNYRGKERENILRFSGFLGMTGQVVNDVNDFVPAKYNIAPMSKVPEDAFADIRNDNITLPLIFYFNSNKKKTIQDLQVLVMKNPSLLLRGMRDSIFSTQQVAQKAADFSEKFINSSCFHGSLLCDMNSIVYFNKNRYYRALEDFVGDSYSGDERPFRNKKQELNVFHFPRFSWKSMFSNLMARMSGELLTLLPEKHLWVFIFLHYFFLFLV